MGLGVLFRFCFCFKPSVQNRSQLYYFDSRQSLLVLNWLIQPERIKVIIFHRFLELERTWEIVEASLLHSHTIGGKLKLTERRGCDRIKVSWLVGQASFHLCGRIFCVSPLSPAHLRNLGLLLIPMVVSKLLFWVKFIIKSSIMIRKTLPTLHYALCPSASDSQRDLLPIC